MPDFRWVNIAKTQENYFRVEWDIYSDPTDVIYSVDDFNFKVLYSSSPASEFETVQNDIDEDVIIDGMVSNNYTHDREQYDFDKKRYYKIKAIHKTIDLEFESGAVFIGASYDGIHSAIKFSEDMIYDQYVGEPSLALIRKSTGSRCPECWSYERQQCIKSHCDICDGTGFVNGYYRPIPIQISYDAEEKKSIPEKTGENILDIKKARLSNYPLLRPKDLIISQDTYKRYVVVTVNTTKLPILSKNREELSRQNHIVSQILILQEINPDDNEYFANVGDITIPEPLPGENIHTGGKYPWFVGHDPVTADAPINVDGQHLTFSYETSQFEIRNNRLTLLPRYATIMRRERSELTESPAGTFETPDSFAINTLMVFHNGQALGVDADNGIEIIDFKTFRIKHAIDRHGYQDDVLVLYVVV